MVVNTRGRLSAADAALFLKALLALAAERRRVQALEQVLQAVRPYMHTLTGIKSALVSAGRGGSVILASIEKVTERLLAQIDAALEPPKRLPTTAELSGSDPDFTGGVESVEHLRRVRGWVNE